MARCPFAVWDPINGGLGAYSGGPFKIVHHTTEGSTYAVARAAFQQNHSDPHFTVDASTIFQHIDTSETARSLRNAAGGVQTNRDSAVQIELVGFAGRPKDPAALANVARLCRWIESVHGVPQRWPNGHPRHSTNGSDPGGHNRNSQTWDTQGGHFGHSQVPENNHWDPAYTPTEVAVVTPEMAPMNAAMAMESAPQARDLVPAGNGGPQTVAAEELLARLVGALGPLGDRDMELTVRSQGVEVAVRLGGQAAAPAA